MSSLGLGTMTFGRETDEATSHAQLSRFVESGGTLIDTADVYAGSESESIIGRWLRTQSASVRDQMIIATKGRFPTGPGPNDLGLSRRHLSVALEASLRRLQVETIDLYQVHGWDPLTPIEETIGFFDDAVRAGKVRYFGLSNFTGWQLQRTVDVAEFRGAPVPVTLQPQYNLLAREVEWELIPACEANNLGLLPWSPLGGGWLTGKYRREQEPESGTRLAESTPVVFESYRLRSARERTWDVIDAVQRVASERSVSMAKVALAWVHQRPSVSSVILGARTEEQLADNLGAVDLTLEGVELEALDAASEPQTPDYPYGEAAIRQRSRKREGGR